MMRSPPELASRASCKYFSYTWLAEPRIFTSGPEESNVRLGLKPLPPLLPPPPPPPPPLPPCCGLRPPLRERFTMVLPWLLALVPANERNRRTLLTWPNLVRFESPARPWFLRVTGPACGCLHGPQRDHPRSLC